MANAYLKSAASSVRDVVYDVKQQQKQAQVDANDNVSSMEQKLNDLNQQQSQLRQAASNTDSSSVNAQQTALIQTINNEMSDIKKSISDVQSEAKQQIQDLEKRAFDYEGTAKQLEIMP